MIKISFGESSRSLMFGLSDRVMLCHLSSQVRDTDEICQCMYCGGSDFWDRIYGKCAQVMMGK